MLIEKVKEVKITENIPVGNGKIFLIAGPCVIESEDLVMTGMVDFNEERVMWKGFVHTAEFDDQNVDKINDNWCLDFVHRNAVMKWKGGNKN